MKTFPLVAPTVIAILIRFIVGFNSYYTIIAMPIPFWESFTTNAREELLISTNKQESAQEPLQEYCPDMAETISKTGRGKLQRRCTAYFY